MEPIASFLLLIVLTSILPTTTLSKSSSIFHDCDHEDNFTAISTYEWNLRILLPTLVPAAIPSGFINSSLGVTPNYVEALALCRGDVSTEDCGSCLNVSASEAEQICPSAKSARIFYDHCHLRYSNQKFTTTIDTDNHCFSGDKGIVSSSDNARFNASVRALFDELRKYAVHNATSPRLFAAGEIEFGKTPRKIKGMVQCTRDISANECNRCLGIIIGKLSSCYGKSYGARAMTGTCSWRYDIDEFFTWAERVEIPALTEVSPGNFQLQWDKDGGGNNLKAVILAIAIPFGVIFLALNLIGWIYLSRRKEARNSGKSEEHTNSGRGEAYA